MSYNSHAFILVTNNSGGNAIITLAHRYSTNPSHEMTWPSLANNQTTPTPMTVGYNSGFAHPGLDYWWIGLEVLSGPNVGTYQSIPGNADDPDKECFLEKADDGKTLTFSVDTQTFLITEISGSCEAQMEPVSAESLRNVKLKARKAAAG